MSAVKEDEDSAGTQKHKVFEHVGGLTPGTVRVSTDNSKDAVILSRCAIFRPATAKFRFKEGNGFSAFLALLRDNAINVGDTHAQ